MLQRYVPSRKRDLMSALVVKGLTESEQRFILNVVQGCSISVASGLAGFQTEHAGHYALRKPHILKALHAEVQRQLAVDAPLNFGVLKAIRGDTTAPARVRADISLQLMKMAGHVQPTNRDKEPEKAIGDMSREEMIAYIDRNQAEIDKAVDELAARAKDVSATHSAQKDDPPPTKPLDYLE